MKVPETAMQVKTVKNGERVILDPAVTASRVYLYFYMMINIGSLFGSIAMVFAEKYVGFWLAFTLPTLMLCKFSMPPILSILLTILIGLCPMVLFAVKSRYTLTPPSGSVFVNALKLIKFALSKNWSWNPSQL